MPAPDRPEWVLAERRALGHRVARWRAARGWSVDDLAGRAGIGRVSVIRLENGARSTGLDVLVQIARALDLDVGQLLGEDPAAGTGASGDGA